jgi:hypothetical protein
MKRKIKRSVSQISGDAFQNDVSLMTPILTMMKRNAQ